MSNSPSGNVGISVWHNKEMASIEGDEVYVGVGIARLTVG